MWGLGNCIVFKILLGFVRSWMKQQKNVIFPEIYFKQKVIESNKWSTQIVHHCLINQKLFARQNNSLFWGDGFESVFDAYRTSKNALRAFKNSMEAVWRRREKQKDTQTHVLSCATKINFIARSELNPAGPGRSDNEDLLSRYNQSTLESQGENVHHSPRLNHCPPSIEMSRGTMTSLVSP